MLLVFACSVTLFACVASNGGSANLGSGSQNEDDEELEEETEDEENPADKDPDENTPDGGKDDLGNAAEAEFFETVNKSVYNLITTKTETSNSMFGDSITCVDLYRTTIYSDTHYELWYQQEVFNNVGTGDSITSKLPEHTIVYKDGEYSMDGQKVTARPDENMLGVKVSLLPANLGKYSVSEDGTRLTTKLTASELNAILGITVNASGKIDFTVETNGVSLYKIDIDYMHGENRVHIETTYTYIIIEG